MIRRIRLPLLVSQFRDIARQLTDANLAAPVLIPLGFWSPRVVEAITEGLQPPDLTLIALTRRLNLPKLWIAQERASGIGSSQTPTRTARNPILN